MARNSIASWVWALPTGAQPNRELGVGTAHRRPLPSLHPYFPAQRVHIVGLFPGETSLAEVSVIAGVAVDGAAQVKAADDRGGAQVEQPAHGIGQHVMLEAGLIKPGDVVLGTDSHMNLLGAVGAFATGVGNSDVAAAYIGGLS